MLDPLAYTVQLTTEAEIFSCADAQKELARIRRQWVRLCMSCRHHHWILLPGPTQLSRYLHYLEHAAAISCNA